MERDPSKEKPKFQIGRQTVHEFEVYETASTDGEAMLAFRKQIASVSSPEQIRIFEVDGSQPRRDLEKEETMEFVAVKETDGVRLDMNVTSVGWASVVESSNGPTVISLTSDKGKQAAGRAMGLGTREEAESQALGFLGRNRGTRGIEVTVGEIKEDGLFYPMAVAKP